MLSSGGARRHSWQGKKGVGVGAFAYLNTQNWNPRFADVGGSIEEPMPDLVRFQCQLLGGSRRESFSFVPRYKFWFVASSEASNYGWPCFTKK